MAKWLANVGGYVENGYVPCENGRGKFVHGEKSSSNTDWHSLKENDEILKWAIAKTSRDPGWARKYLKEELSSDMDTTSKTHARS